MMELQMRSVFVIGAALVVAGLASGMGIGSSHAAPAPVLTTPEASPAIVDNVAMYRRHYRSAVPAEPLDDGAIVGDMAPPAVVVIRPSSCGLYKYWDGTACVDARYTEPYLGPKG